jgi:uncharacterized protein
MSTVTSSDSESIKVEVVFCPDRSTVDSTVLDLPAGASVDDALRASGVLRRFAGIGPDCAGVGIWGRTVNAAHRLRNGDRVELYRPLVVDPKEARRKRHRSLRKAPAR